MHLGYIQEYTSANLQRGESTEKSRGIMKKAKRFILTWSASEMALTEHVKQNFLVQEHGVKGIVYLLWCTGTSNNTAQNLDLFNDESQS